MLLHATFWSAGFFMRRTVTYIKSYGLHTKMTIQAWPTGCRGESRIQTTSCVRPAAECTAHTTFGEAAGLWLPQSCRQQYRGCHNLAPAARLKQGQPYCGSHDVAAGKILATTMLLPARLWQKILPQCCCRQHCGAAILKRCTGIFQQDKIACLSNVLINQGFYCSIYQILN